MLALFVSAATVLAVALLSCTDPAYASVPLVDQVTFGHSIKNGHLPANTELTTFAYNCTVPPCVVTLIHVPSIYPSSGEPWDWQHGVLNVYVDDETVPSVSITMLQLGAVGEQGSHGEQVHDGSPFGVDLVGKTANHGGTYSTVRIPFLRSIRTTVRSAYTHDGVLWFIIRGLEAHPVILGDLQLPSAARLRVAHRDNVFLNNGDFITLVNVTADRSGALLRVQLDAGGSDFSYLEACMRFYNNGATTPLYLSSGAEDYFLSSSYFDEGMFKTPNSGLTYYDSHSNLSAYKHHHLDPVLFRNGMALVWRNCESTSGCGTPALCPNQFCYPGQSGVALNSTVEAMIESALRRRGRLPPSNTNAVYTTVVWYYDWPSDSVGGTAGAPEVQVTSASHSPIADDPLARCLPLLQRLEQGGLVSKAAADALVDAVLAGEHRVVRLCNSGLYGAKGSVDLDAFVARQLLRAL